LSPPNGVARISISLPQELLKSLDELVKRSGYDRSRIVQQAIRNTISEMEWLQASEEEVAGALLTLYDHTVRGAEDTLTDLQHSFRDIVQGAFHMHLDDKNCLEAIFVRGRMKRVKELLQQIEGIKSVKQVKVSVIASKVITT